MTTAKVGENSQYSDEIKIVIEAYGNSDFLKQIYYAFYDIDSNGTQELLLGDGLNIESIRIGTVYTITDDVVLRQDEYHYPEPEAGPPPLLFINGTIRVDSNSYDGELGFGYYCFENGTLKHQIGLVNERGSYFRILKELPQLIPITKAEFERLKREMEGDGQVVELDWKPLAEYGR